MRTTGDVPSEIEQLTITKLILNDNRLTGPTPSELGSMSNVELVCLQNQFLAGSLPTELGQLRALDLRLNDMRLSRLMPSEMWLNEALHILHLGGNGIACPFNLPLAMGRTTSLVDVRLQNMELTGSIPAQIGQ